MVPLVRPASPRGPSSAPLGVAVLGSTGSVGTQTLDVITHHPERFRVVALAAGSNVALLAGQARAFRPDLVALEHPTGDLDLPAGSSLLIGTEGLTAAATHRDAGIVVVATSGHAAIEPTLAAIAAGKIVAIANKETIVCAGALVAAAITVHGSHLRPVDSEHSALWQALLGGFHADIDRLVLTASGGPFRGLDAARLAGVRATDALHHPTWTMGQKVTIDSATLMNKGLEVIEAHWLFGIPYERIEVVVHPESIVHSLVAFADGSQIAQLSYPDMRLPIQFALTYPHHIPGPQRHLRLDEVGALTFEAPDETRFPALRLAREAGQAGSTYPTVLSAADEVLVHAFVEGRVPFTGIAATIERVLAAHRSTSDLTLAAIRDADAWARAETARQLLR
ncbi:MAG: 1-deoxy-D-xylulose-5-phosphate reductoisomerase [Chloroflexota bacterium]|nr:1-deoxy-D-xylulose-5-phosphate reductoisomerase [Chloroflexota bacterium]